MKQLILYIHTLPPLRAEDAGKRVRFLEVPGVLTLNTWVGTVRYRLDSLIKKDLITNVLRDRDRVL